MGGAKRKITPVLRRKLKRLKKKYRPRGRGFAKGNSFGVRTRFTKGQSGNPGGRPSYREIGSAIRAALSSEHLVIPCTTAERVAAVWIRQALKGNVGALSSLANRAEGLPLQAVAIDQGASKMDTILEAMAGWSQTLGPPPGQEADADERLALEAGEPITEEAAP